MAVTKKQVRDQLLGLRELYGNGKKRMTQEAAARKVGTSERQWQRWERMVTLPEPENLSAIADAFDISLDVFDDGKADKAGVPLAERLNDIDRKLDEILKRLPEPATTEEDEGLDDVEVETERLDEDEDASDQAAGQ